MDQNLHAWRGTLTVFILSFERQFEAKQLSDSFNTVPIIYTVRSIYLFLLVAACMARDLDLHFLNLDILLRFIIKYIF